MCYGIHLYDTGLQGRPRSSLRGTLWKTKKIGCQLEPSHEGVGSRPQSYLQSLSSFPCRCDAQALSSSSRLVIELHGTKEIRETFPPSLRYEGGGEMVHEQKTDRFARLDRWVRAIYEVCGGNVTVVNETR